MDNIVSYPSNQNFRLFFGGGGEEYTGERLVLNSLFICILFGLGNWEEACF